jgi:VWFA-related protein
VFKEFAIMYLRRFIIPLILLSLALPLAAQDNIRLTVSVTTADSSPVRDLKKTDFSLQDAGKPRPIDSFSSPSQKPAAPPQLGVNQYTNIPDFTESSGAIFVVLDTIHTRYLDERDIRAMVLKFLARAAQAKHGVTLAILSDTGLHVYHDFHTSSDVLLAALIKAGLGGMKGTAAPAGVNDADVTAEAARLTAFAKGDQSNATSQDRPLRSNIDFPLVMFQDIGHAAAGLPGQKALIWVTNIVPFDIDPKSFQFVSPKQANRGAAINAGGGLGSPAVQGTQLGGTKDALSGDQIKRITPIWRQSMRSLFDGGVAIYPMEARGSSSSGSDSFTVLVMKVLAQLTGGKAFLGSNDPFPDILQTSNGNTAGYGLGFTGDSNVGTELHRVQASVSQSALRVNGPVGYFPVDLTKSRAQDEITLALQSPLEYTGIPFRVELTGTEDSGGKKKANFTISLPGDSGLLNETTRKVDLGIVAQAKNAKGDIVGKLSEGAGGQFPPEAVAQIKELGFQLKRSIEVPGAGDFTLHLVIRDNPSGRMGSIAIPLNVK